MADAAPAHGAPRRITITAEPFTRTIDGVEFGWKVHHHDDGTYTVTIEPGDFICYYEPWDGYEYDT
ncbi:hypothetical protein GCM10009868_31320 [Terrabacter aerolatus]|uniref:Uncharacterized protein n=1 Tax=Terrabacter aerolatus TaxID=422442 RepID=A0A512CYZ0_9MICO|nr:hypothetical protein [Terrabacter aerolatus]GEO29424.1 hypothetical protein TAE01_12340 [Terrabacter aerolatus]